MEGFSLRNTNKKIEPFARIANRGRNRMEQHPKKKTSRTKTGQRNNNKDKNNKNEIR